MTANRLAVEDIHNEKNRAKLIRGAIMFNLCYKKISDRIRFVWSL